VANREEPVGNTCPTIDDLIEKVKESIRAAVEINHLVRNEPNEEELDQIRYAADEIENVLFHAEDQLEEIRDANSQLRYWGLELADELDSAEKYIYDLENRLDEQ
jgi:hypothetical protein